MQDWPRKPIPIVAGGALPAEDVGAVFAQAAVYARIKKMPLTREAVGTTSLF